MEQRGVTHGPGRDHNDGQPSLASGVRVGLVMISISAVKMLTSVITRAIIIYQRKGLGPWILTAAWGSAFQLAFLPVYWASESGQRQAEYIVRRMEERAGEVGLPAAGGGSGLLSQVKNSQQENADLVRLLKLCSGGVCHECCC
jgi:hypothetical protein